MTDVRRISGLLPFLICHFSSAICHFSSAICHFSSAICHAGPDALPPSLTTEPSNPRKNFHQGCCGKSLSTEPITTYHEVDADSTGHEESSNPGER